MLEILPGQPTDMAAVSPLITATDEHLFGYLTGGRLGVWQALTATEWYSDAGIYSYRHSRVARDAGRVVGVLVAYTAAEHEAIDWTHAGARAILPPDLWALVESRLALANFLFPDIPEGAYYVQNIAVAESARGTGLGRRLMEVAFDTARQASCTSCHLDVDSSTPAVGFYQRLGMRCLVRTEVPDLPGIAPHLRMVIDL
jgi:ribosomal protein S18 acetylase RimI-like enzyme